MKNKQPVKTFHPLGEQNAQHDDQSEGESEGGSEGQKIDQACPGCGAEFQCNSADIEQCQCFGVNLDAQVVQQLRAQAGLSADLTLADARCFCRACLLSAKAGVK